MLLILAHHTHSPFVQAQFFAAEDEDFGITPVEAMICGTSVIAYKSGGVLETVMENPSASHSTVSSDRIGSGSAGLFFDELSIESLSKAIKQFNNLTINPLDCIKHAQKFSKERFKREIREFVKGRVNMS